VWLAGIHRSIPYTRPGIGVLAMNVARRIGANMVAAVGGKAIIALTGVATVAIMTRQLGVADYGVLRTALTFVLFPATFANLGLNYIMLREVGVETVRADRIVSAALGLRLTAGALFLAAGLGISLLIPWSPIVRWTILIASVGMLAYIGNEIITGVLQWQLRQELAIVAEVAGAAVTLAGVVLATKLGLGVLSMAAVSTVGFLLTFLLAWALAGRLRSVRPIVDKEIWWQLVRPGLPLAASAWFTLVSLRGDTLLLSLLKPAAEVGFYGVATKIYEVGLQLPILFGGLLMPLFARSANDPRQLRTQVTAALHVLVVVGIAIVLGLGFFARDIVVLLAGPAFIPSTAAVQIAGMSLALAGCTAALRYAAVAQGRQMRLMALDGVTSVLAVITYLILIPSLSFIGAAIGTLVVEIVMLISLSMLVGKGVGGIPWPTHLVRTLLAGLLAAAGIALLHETSLPVWAVGSFAILIYAGLLMLTGALTVSQLRAVLVTGP
jgi:O-antigen/teichoic acid export membrane protein